MKNFAAVAMCTLLLSALAFAHGDFEHVMGTVTEVTDHSISVKTTDGSVKVVAFDSETHFLKGSDSASIKDVIVGSRVVIHAHKHGDTLHAAEVKIGLTTAATSHP
jgi:hypothetical protein